MTKAEMEQHHAAYHALMDQVSTALRAWSYREAVDLAVSSFSHVDGMMQFEKKYGGKEATSVASIDFVLEYAPLMFDVESLDNLEELLGSQKRIAKNVSVDLGDQLRQARLLMWEAHRFWHYLEQHLTVGEDNLRVALGGDSKQWRSIAKSWADMGLVNRLSNSGHHQLSLVTHLDQPVLAKCPSCAAVVKAVKEKVLEERSCPKCRQKRLFVLLAKEPESHN